MSDGTIRYVHRLLRAALQDAVAEDDILTENVAKGLQMDHKYRSKFMAWSPAEARTFLKGARETVCLRSMRWRFRGVFAAVRRSVCAGRMSTSRMV
jgi:hypothetical protein